jgi:hypothetical protein
MDQRTSHTSGGTDRADDTEIPADPHEAEGPAPLSEQGLVDAATHRLGSLAMKTAFPRLDPARQATGVFR